MTRPDLLYRLASGIATIEGFFVAGSLPARNNNPGDLRAAPWLAHQTVKDFWQAPSLAMGIAGLYHQIALDVARGYTLRQMVTTWAPPSDGNNTERYVSDLSALTGIPPDQPLCELLALDHLTKEE
jgi:hypothetical protein